MTAIEHLTWWGCEGTVFGHRDKPGLRPSPQDRIGIDIALPPRAPPDDDPRSVIPLLRRLVKATR